MTSRIARTAATLAVLIVAAAPAGVASAGPDTNIQKPGHVAIVCGDCYGGGAVSISRPLGVE